MCGYRSPSTNAMLRRRSEGVARYSQHILGRAMDFFIPGVPLEAVREIGLRLARGGVGFYPESGSPFVHMDVGGIRMWPRMTHEQLVHVFPDGRTVQIPIDGKPLAGYALALADVTKHGAMPSENSLAAARTAGINIDTALASNAPLPTNSGANPFAKLLGLAKDGEEEEADAEADAGRLAPECRRACRARSENRKEAGGSERNAGQGRKRDRKAETRPRRETAAYRCSFPLRNAALPHPADPADPYRRDGEPGHPRPRLLGRTA